MELSVAHMTGLRGSASDVLSPQVYLNDSGEPPGSSLTPIRRALLKLTRRMRFHIRQALRLPVASKAGVLVSIIALLGVMTTLVLYYHSNIKDLLVVEDHTTLSYILPKRGAGELLQRNDAIATKGGPSTERTSRRTTMGIVQRLKGPAGGKQKPVNNSGGSRTTPSTVLQYMWRTEPLNFHLDMSIFKHVSIKQTFAGFSQNRNRGVLENQLQINTQKVFSGGVGGASQLNAQVGFKGLEFVFPSVGDVICALAHGCAGKPDSLLSGTGSIQAADGQKTIGNPLSSDTIRKGLFSRDGPLGSTGIFSTP